MSLILACGAFPPSYVLLVFSPFILLIGLPLLAAATSDARNTKRWRATTSRAAKDQCLHCGYDLRATPCRCPECGTPAQPSSGAFEPMPSAI